MKKSNLILLATFWNEKDWIEISLEQIEKINPLEILICDGCFDQRVKPAQSTDGTREIIKKYVQKKPNAKLIEPVRTGKLRGLKLLYIGHRKNPLYHYLYPSRIISTLRGIKKTKYRVNQALTFNKMISKSEEWKTGRWFMNYDSDQFYNDEMIKRFQSLDENVAVDLITGTEKTFFKNFKNYTLEYDLRVYNNMPHKIYPQTVIYPTRDIFVEHPLNRNTYHENLKSVNMGFYSHYKIKSKKRWRKGYELGDRVMPETTKFKYLTEDFVNHPSVIRRNINILRNNFKNL